MASTESDASRYSINYFTGDGSTTVWNFNFAGGYISQDHVKAVTVAEDGTGTQLDLAFVGTNTVQITPAVASGVEFRIYRDTPKDKPIADFSDGSYLTEKNLDANADQAVFIAAEAYDRFGDDTAAIGIVAEAKEFSNSAATAASAASAFATASQGFSEASSASSSAAASSASAAALAETSATSAAAQAEIAALSSKVFGPSAATTVPPGVADQETYWVASDDGGSLLLYANNAGSAVTAPIGGTQVKLGTASNVLFYSAQSGFSFANQLGFEHLGAGADGVHLLGGTWAGTSSGGFQFISHAGEVLFGEDLGSLKLAGATVEPSSSVIFAITNQLGFASLVIDADGTTSLTLDGSDAEIVAPSVVPIMGDHLFSVSDRPIPFYPENLFPKRSDEPYALVTIDSRRGPPTQPFPAQTAFKGPIMLDQARMGSGATVTVRAKDAPSALLTHVLSVSRKTVPVTGSPARKILMLGDSITNRQGAYFVNLLLTNWGFVPTFIGTMAGSSSATGATAGGGPLGEGREGWATSDFLGLRPDNDWTSVLAAGGEAAYLADTKANQLRVQPFLQVAGSSSSAAPTATISGTDYKFDMSFYLSRFSLATPDFVILNLGMNDLLEGHVEEFATYYPVILAEIRRAMPSAKIICWATAKPRDTISDSDWEAKWHPILASLCSIVRALRTAGDTNIYVCSAWAHMTPDVGFQLNAGTTDPVTGVTSTSFADTIHSINTPRDQVFEAIASAIANLS